MSVSARDIAVKALLDRRGHVGESVDYEAARGGLSRQDAGLARELALGCVRRRATLRAVLRAFLVQPDRKLPDALWQILNVGLYQVLYLDRVPDFAAVSEAVEQAGRFSKPRSTGLVNGLLRTILRSLGPREAGEVPLAADAIPVGPRAFRRCDRPVLPDPGRDAAAYLAAAGNLPDVLAGRWLKSLGSLAEAAAVAAQACQSPPLIARVNGLKADVPGAIVSIQADGAEAVAHANGCSVVLGHGTGLTELAAFREGWLQPQDPTATAVSLATGVAPGMNVLDLCAAPGTKTTHLAELMAGQGAITAVDVPGRLHLVADNCRRMGVDIVTTRSTEEMAQLPEASFDVVLADVPCTNTGVLSRRPEAKWHFSADGLHKVVADQKFLLSAAAVFVRPGGRLVYSTCSLEPEEDEMLVGRFAKAFPKVKLLSKSRTLPGGADDATQWHDGGFAAIFQST